VLISSEDEMLNKMASFVNFKNVEVIGIRIFSIKCSFIIQLHPYMNVIEIKLENLSENRIKRSMPSDPFCTPNLTT
jgi:hypothetical protein